MQKELSFLRRVHVLSGFFSYNFHFRLNSETIKTSEEF